MSNILDQIVRTKQSEVARAKVRRPLADLKRAIGKSSSSRDFWGLIAAQAPHGIHLIAELKRGSPSAGLIRPDFDPVSIAQTCCDAGASALSVVTEETYFQGRLEYLEEVKTAVALPMLRKDFIVDAYQVYESCAAGADCVLLIAEVLGVPALKGMLDVAFDLDMATLIEVHDEQTLEAVNREIGFPNDKRTLLGINNRDLKAQQTDIETTVRLAKMVTPGTILVSESGIQQRLDVQRVMAAGCGPCWWARR